MDTTRVSRPMAQGLRDRGRRRTPLESGTLSTSSESSSVLEAMTGTAGGSPDKDKGAFSTDPFCALVGFQDEKLPDRRLRADWDLVSKLVRLLSEVMDGLWLFAGLPRVWAEVACAVEVASRSRPREFEEVAAATLTGRGFLKSSPSSEPEDRLCIPTTVGGASAVSGRDCSGDRGRERGVGAGMSLEVGSAEVRK